MKKFLEIVRVVALGLLLVGAFLVLVFGIYSASKGIAGWVVSWQDLPSAPAKVAAQAATPTTSPAEMPVNYCNGMVGNVAIRVPAGETQTIGNVVVSCSEDGSVLSVTAGEGFVPQPQATVAPAQAGADSPAVGAGSAPAVQTADTAAMAEMPQPQAVVVASSDQPEMAAASADQPAQLPAQQPAVNMGSIPVLSASMVPLAPYFADGDIIDIANAGLASCGPKCSVYPRVIKGGEYSDQHSRDAFESAMLQGAARSMGTTDMWSVFSYAGVISDDVGAWFYALTEETADPQELAAGVIQEVVFLDGSRKTIESPTVRLDAMMAVNLVSLQNVGARALTKNPGVLSLVLVDGQTSGSASVGFAISPQFVNNFTGGSPSLVPAVVINGMPGQPVRASFYDSNSQMVSTTDGQIESTNGTATVEVPVGGGFVVVSLPIVGTGPNSNTEVLFRMAGQPIPDTPGKNWFPAP